MSYREESLYWKGRGMDSSQSEPVVSSNGQGEAAGTDPVRTLRDEFAMAALTALLVKPIVAADRRAALVSIGREAYQIADGMMKGRQS